MTVRLGLAFAILVAGAPALAAGPLAVGGDPSVKTMWQQVVAGPNDDWINDLVPIANGNILGVGFLNRNDDATNADWQAVSVELSPGGKRVAEHRYGQGGGTDAFWSVLEGAGNRRTFAGFTTRMGGGGIDGLLVTTGADGKLINEAAFGAGGYDRFTDLTQAGDGTVFVGHSQLPTSDLRRVYLVKTDKDGAKLWERIFEGPEAWGGLYVEPTGDGGFVISGGVSADGADGDMFVIRTDSDGRELWRKRVGTSDWDEINHGLLVRPDGSIVLIGYTHAHGSQTNDIVAASLTKNGELTRLERFGGTGDERAISSKFERDRVWIVGHTESAGAGGTDIVVASLDADGSFAPGAITIGGPADDNGTAVLPLDNGSLLVAGYSRNLGVGGQDAFIARVTRPNPALPNAAFKRTVVTPTR